MSELQAGGRGRGRGIWRSIFQRGGDWGRGGRGNEYHDPAVPYNTINGVDIREHTLEFGADNWEQLGNDVWANVGNS